MRDAPPARLENYVKYIGTREGVEKIDESRLLLPAMVKQQQLIGQIIRDIPSAKDMLEYADYCENPTIGNATEFISLTLEQNLNLIGKRENYVEYIAVRPRVERIGKMYAAGLGTDQDYGQTASRFQEALRLYTLSADQGNPYVDYELAKMHRDGVGTPVDAATSDQHFKSAFSGFYRLEKDSHDDKLQYRLGQMLYTGTIG